MGSLIGLVSCSHDDSTGTHDVLLEAGQLGQNQLKFGKVGARGRTIYQSKDLRSLIQSPETIGVSRAPHSPIKSLEVPHLANRHVVGTDINNCVYHKDHEGDP